jgi:dynein light chain LC8-type
MLEMLVSFFLKLIFLLIQMSLDKLVPVVKLTDMTDDMQKEVIEVARVGIDRSSTVFHLSVTPLKDQQIATHIKDDFRSRYHGTWHCIVGRNFGSFVTHETKHYIYFYIGQIAIMLFKTG